MRSKKVYIYHEYGAVSHYYALCELAKKYNYKVYFYEFDLFYLLKQCIKKKYSYLKLCADFFALLKMPFICKSKIVIGIAPFNPLLKRMMLILKKHEVYYHTSCTYWDRTFMIYPTTNKKLISQWYFFTNNYVHHIFAVTNKTKEELINNKFSIPEKITVVAHSYNEDIDFNANKINNKVFIYVGRIIPEKGIQELLDIFKNKRNAKLIIIGNGTNVELVKEYAKKYSNITYVGYIKGFKNLIPYYRKSSFLLLNSHRTHSWEELFGITIIEGMACGCVPITTDHPGPKEIITNNVDGIICKEGHICDGIDKALCLSDKDYSEYSKSALKTGKKYSCKNIAKYWNRIFL